MKTILHKRANLGLIRRITAALLTIVMVSSYMIPLEGVYAESKDHWETDYFMEVDGDIPISHDDGALYLDVTKGEEVNFHMLLTEKSMGGSGRFQESFNITMAEELYALMAEDGRVFEEGWLEHDHTESGYLLEVIDPDMSPSATGSDATGSNASGSDASGSNSHTRTRESREAGMHKVTFRFDGELRNEKNPQGISIDESEGILSFIAPDDMRIKLIRDGNNCRIEMEPPVQIMPLASTLDGMDIKLSIKQSDGAFGDRVSWNPVGYADETLITMRVEYGSSGLNNYAAGELELTIDGLTGNLSEYWTNLGAYYEPASTVNAEQWNYTYDKNAAQFTFTNKDAIDTNTNFQGYFEITWSIDGRLKADDYSFEAELTNGTDTLTSEECTFAMKKDVKVQVNQISKTGTNADDEEMLGIYKSLPASRDNYYWIRYQLRRQITGNNYDTMLMEYMITDVMPAGVIVLDSQFNEATLSGGNAFEYSVNRPSHTSTYQDTIIYVGYPIGTYNVDQIVTNEFSIIGRYEDETAFVPLGKANSTTPLKAFDFTYNGNMYGIEKSPYRINSTTLNQVRYHHERSGVTNTIFDIDVVAIYNNNPMDVVIGDDVLYVSRADGSTTRLEDDEYYFESVNFPSFSNVFNEPFTGYDYTLEVRKAGETAYETHSSGQLLATQTANFDPDEQVVAWRLTLHDIDDDIRRGTIRTTVDVAADDAAVGKLYNFTYLKVMINGVHVNQVAESNYASGFTRDEIAPYDLATYNSYLQRDEANFNVYDSSNYWYVTKSSTAARNDSAEKKYKLDYSVYSYTSLTSSIWNDQYLSEYTVYDILPEGVYFEENDIDVTYLRTGQTTGAFVDQLTLRDGTEIGSEEEIRQYLSDRTTVSIDTDYRGSGRTRISFILDLSDNPIDLNELIVTTAGMANASSSSFLYMMNARIPVVIPYDTLDAYGGVVKNNVYLDAVVLAEGTSSAPVYLGSVDDDGTHDPLAEDINNNGRTTGEKLGYNQDTQTIPHAGSSYQEIKKLVRTSDTGGQFVTDTSLAQVNEIYTYRLRIRTSSNPVGSLVFYDTIETILDSGGNDITAGWKGRLVGFDTSRAESLGFAPVIYYSESLTPDSLITNPLAWKEYEEGVTDRSKVKTVAFDLRYDSNGDEFNVAPDTILYVDVTMKSLAVAESTNAENQFRLEWMLMNGAGVPSGIVTELTSNCVEVELTGTTTAPETDLKLNLADGNGVPVISGSGSYELYYDPAAAADPVLTTGNTQVVLVTNPADGSAETTITLDPGKEHLDGSYTIYLKESAKPDGYYSLGGKNSEPSADYIVEIVLKPNLSGEYVVVSSNVTDIFDIAVNSGGQNDVTLIYHTRPLVVVELELNVKLLNADAADDEELPITEPYTFHASLVSGNHADVMIPQSGMQNGSGGGFSFSGIEITAPGIYTFAITEEVPASLHTAHTLDSYDPGTITATVQVTEAGGVLAAGPIVYNKTLPAGKEHHFDKNPAKEDDTFVNYISLKAGSDSVVLESETTLIGRELADQEFTVKADQIYSSNGMNFGEVTIKNDPDGNVVFPLYNFTAPGDYIFELSELTGTDGRIIYSDSVYYAYVKVYENRIGGLTAEWYYGTGYDAGTHTVGGFLPAGEVPVFENRILGSVSIQVVSKADSHPLSGSELELYYRPKGSSDTWQQYGSTLVTTGTDSMVNIDLMTWFQDYEFKLVQTDSLSGYYKNRVGTVMFTMSPDGTIESISSDGTNGYIELSADGSTVIVKNYQGMNSIGGGSSSGGSSNSGSSNNGPGAATAADPENPGTETSALATPVPGGKNPDYSGVMIGPGQVEVKDMDGNVIWSGYTEEGYVDIKLDPGNYIVTISDGSAPLTYIMDVPVPLSGEPGGKYVFGSASTGSGSLARTGDSAVTVWMLVMMMTAAAGLFGTVWRLRRKPD